MESAHGVCHKYGDFVESLLQGIDRGRVWLWYRALHSDWRISLCLTCRPRYLLNPYLFLPSLALSTSTFDNTLFLLALHSASLGKSLSESFQSHVPYLYLFRKFGSISTITGITHSYVSYVCPYSPAYFISHACWSIVPPRQSDKICWFQACSASSTPIFYILHITRFNFCPGGRRLELDWPNLGSRVSDSHPRLRVSVYLRSFRLTLPELNPNPGLWWYYFTEMFDHFRPFFLMTFSVCPLSVDLGLSQCLTPSLCRCTWSFTLLPFVSSFSENVSRRM